MAESVSLKVAAIVAEHFDPVLDGDGAAYIVPRRGARVALPVRGIEARELVLNRYVAAHGAIPSRSALSDAMDSVAACVRGVEPVVVGLRVAEEPASGAVYVDLGRPDGYVVRLDDGGWAVEAPGKVLFRRTALTAPMPVPWHRDDGVPAWGLADLRGLLNVDDEGWAMVLGWMVAAFIPDLAHPVLLVRGEQGTGKSMLARMLIDLVDPSVVPLRRAPRDEAAWIVPAAGSWVVGIDNVSSISEWWSDALCSVVTGDGEAKRRLYTDGDLAVSAFRRAVVLTSIGIPTIRGDLGDRLITVEAQTIASDSRRTEQELRAHFRELQPFILGELLDLVWEVLRRRASSGSRMTRKARMADFAVVLHALDRVRPGVGALDHYLWQQSRLNQDVVEGDLVALALLAMAEGGGWEGTMAELLARLPLLGVGEKALPSTPKALSVRVKRMEPALRGANVRLTRRRSRGRDLLRVGIESPKTDETAGV